MCFESPHVLSSVEKFWKFSARTVHHLNENICEKWSKMRVSKSVFKIIFVRKDCCTFLAPDSFGTFRTLFWGRGGGLFSCANHSARVNDRQAIFGWFQNKFWSQCCTKWSCASWGFQVSSRRMKFAVSTWMDKSCDACLCLPSSL